MDFLAKHESLCALIADCHEVAQAKKLHDQAAGIEEFARRAKNRHAELQLGVIRLRCARRAGELLTDMAKKGERDAGRGGNRKSQSNDSTVKTLSDLGVSKYESSLWQEVAEIAQEKFERALELALKNEDSTLSVVSIINLCAALAAEPTTAKKCWDDAKMFDFHQPDNMPKRTLHVHFLRAEHVNDFAKRIGQKLGPRTKTIWFPEKPKTIVQ